MKFDQQCTSGLERERRQTEGAGNEMRENGTSGGMWESKERGVWK